MVALFPANRIITSMRSDRFKTFLEIIAVFAVFFLFGAWMTPDVNETHYIGKAINYWNPDWIQGDPFLESRDAHWTFYFVFGWLTFFFSPVGMAWIGRVIAWGLLAWSWQRLSYTLIPVRWVAIPTALALAYYIESFHMAGEWLIGGIEGKSLAYPFVFFALAAILRRQWNRAGIFLGIACAFHVLVGGWTTIIAGVLFFASGDWRRRTTSPLPKGERGFSFPWIGLIVGGATALCGLIPVLMLDAGVCAAIICKAHQIYVFDRLPHHLVPYMFRDTFLLRFALLAAIWILLCRHLGGGRRQRIFNGFIWGTLGLAAIGMIIAYGLADNRELSASLLRFYWFRLSDVAVPMGVAIGATRFCIILLSPLLGERARVRDGARKEHNTPYPNLLPVGEGVAKLLPKVLAVVLAIAAIYFTATYLCFVHFGLSPADQNVPWAITLLVCLVIFTFRQYAKSIKDASMFARLTIVLVYIAIAFYAPLTVLPRYMDLRTHAAFCRSEPVGPQGRRAAAEWQDMCRWIKENTEPTAKFWIPRDGQTFKWHARRADVGVWKNIPQDAAAIVEWRQAMDDLFRFRNEEGETMTDRLLTTLLNNKTDEQIAELRQLYGFDYILCAQAHEMPQHSTLQLVYENDVYVLYRVLEFPLVPNSCL